MDTYVINGVCRCCASQGSSKDIDTSYTWMGGEEIYSKMLRDCFDIALSRSVSGHDGGICELCVTQLRNAYNFKKQVVSTEEMLKKRLNSDQFKPSLVKVELEVHPERISDSDNDMGDHMDQDSGDDHSTKEFLVPIKSEVQEAPEVKPKRRATKAGTSAAKKPKLEAETSKNASRRLPPTSKSVQIPVKREPRSDDEQDNKPLSRIKVKLSQKEDSEPNQNRGRRKIYYQSSSSTAITKIVYKTINESTAPFERLKTGGPHVNKLQEIHKQISNVQMILLYTNATPIGIRHGARSRNYGCVYCEETFLKPADLKTHSLTHDARCKLEYQKLSTLSVFVARLDITGLKCNLCNAEMQSLDDASDHLKTVHDKKMFTTATKRIVPFKFDSDVMFCCLCNTDYSTFKSLSTHMNKHFRNCVCEVCDGGFITERMLKTHMKSHEEMGNHKCSHCDKHFTTDGKKRRHERIVHVLQGKTHACAYCGERFAYHGLSIKHLHEKHGIEMPVYKCRACDAAFDAKRKLSRHIKKDHLMEKNFACAECDMRFFDRDGLKEHQLKHNGKRDYKCPICLKAYGRRHTLRNHMRIHIDDRRFKCDYCDQTFVQKCSLKGHLKSRHNIVMENQNITPLPSKPLVLDSLFKS